MIKKSAPFFVLMLSVFIWGCPPNNTTSVSVTKDMVYNLTIFKPTKDTTCYLATNTDSIEVKWQALQSIGGYLPDNYKVCIDKDIYPRNGRQISIETNVITNRAVIRRSDFSTIPLTDTTFFLYVTTSVSKLSITDTRSADVRLITIKR